MSMKLTRIMVTVALCVGLQGCGQGEKTDKKDKSASGKTVKEVLTESVIQHSLKDKEKHTIMTSVSPLDKKAHGLNIELTPLQEASEKLWDALSRNNYDKVKIILEEYPELATEATHQQYEFNVREGKVVEEYFKKVPYSPLRKIARLSRLTHEPTFEIAKLLISKRADLNQGDSRGDTILHELVKETPRTDEELKLATEFLELLLENGANINAKNSRGETPIMWFFTLPVPSIKMLKLYLRHGADLNVTFRDGRTPLEVVQEQYNKNLKEIDDAATTEDVKRREEEIKEYKRWVEATKEVINYLESRMQQANKKD